MTAKEIVSLVRAGVKVTVNSDDPAYFGGYVADNSAVLAGEIDVTVDELIAIARHSFEVARLTSRA
jgi:adenine deaminase